MKRTDINLRLEAIARCCCAAIYLKENPDCTPIAAWGHSNRHWWTFVESAIKIMALAEAADEVAAAPWN